MYLQSMPWGDLGNPVWYAGSQQCPAGGRLDMKLLLGFLLAAGIGVVCRLAGIPVPAPPAIVGALLVLSMTTGYLLVGRLARQRPHRNEPLSGGPMGPATGEGD
jgi:XapX domain-containing protein